MESAGKKVRDQGTQSLYSDSIDACDRVGHGGVMPPEKFNFESACED